MTENARFICLRIPVGKGQTVELDLEKVDIFASGFRVNTPDGFVENIEESLGTHYRGVIKGNDFSLAVISVFKNEILGFFSTGPDGNFVLGRLGGENTANRHILYNDADLKVKPSFFCNTKDDDVVLPESALQHPEEMTTNCVRIYIEADYDIFVNKGSVGNTVSYVAGLFNQVSVLFANDSLPSSLSELFVWTQPSPYTGQDSFQQLQIFRNLRTTFNGDLAHLISLDNFGGVAFLPGLCSTGFNYAYSGIYDFFDNVPAYSWSVDVFSHEMRHNLGSPHTHGCYWNGDNTAIDGCGQVAGYPEGSCPTGPIPPSGGTVMSYCHLNAVGKNFSFGFGTQPSNVMLNSFKSAACLIDCAGGSTPTATPTITFTATETPTDTPTPTATETPELIYGMTTASSSGFEAGIGLVSFSSNTPATITTIGPFAGVVSGHGLRSIDFRPATGQLYAISTNNVPPIVGQIYTVNLATAVLTPVGSGFTLGTSDTPRVEMEFDPVTDRVRVITHASGSSGFNNNFRVNPNDGTLEATDTNLAYDAGDPRAGNGSFFIIGTAYSNNVAGAESTTLYGWDYTADTLLTIGGLNGTPNPNGGLMFSIHTPPTILTARSGLGMDISGESGILYVTHDTPSGSLMYLYTRSTVTGLQLNRGSYPAGTFISDISVFIPLATPSPTNTATATATVTETFTPTATPANTPFCNGANLDTSFNATGVVTTPINSDDVARAVAIQTDGKIVTAGRSSNGSSNDFAVVRYNPNGSLDTSFGGTGIVTTPVGSFDDSARAVAIQSDGKIVVAGQSSNGSNLDFAVVRYNTDGSMDTSFGGGTGKVTTFFGVFDDSAHSVAIQADGKIVAAGDARPDSISSVFGIVRYNSDGSLDPSFSVDGKVTTSVGIGESHADSVAIQTDTKIVVAGNGYSTFSSLPQFAVARYNSDGSVDASFSGDGQVVTTIGSGSSQSEAYAVAMQSDGHIVTAGTIFGSTALFSMVIVRYNTDGTVAAIKVTSISGYRDEAYAVAIQPDDKIVAAGSSRQNIDRPRQFALVRYNADAELDTSFNGTGKVVTPGTDRAFSVAIQPDGKIVAAGQSSNGANFDFAVVRYRGSTASCPPVSTSGTITYGNPSGTPTPRFVSNVTLSGAGSPNVSTTSDAIGNYLLAGFGVGSYTVTPTKIGGVNAAISSFDAARIAQHVTSVFALTGNQLLVADVSNNGQISSFDAAQVANYAVSGSPVGIAGTWKFLPTNRSYPSVISNVTGEDYSALLMGEISGNWTNTLARPVSVSRQETRDESQEAKDSVQLAVAVGSRTVAEKEFVVPVNVEGIADKKVISYEFDLRYDPAVMQPLLEPVDVSGTISRGLTVVANATEPGLLRVVVYGAYPIDENGVLLNLRFASVGAAGSVSPLLFERIKFNEGESRVSITDGKIELF